MTLRAGSGFHSKAVLTTCRRAGVRSSVTARLNKAVQGALATIPDKAWVPIPHWSSSGTPGPDGHGQPVSGADVAKVRYTAFGKQGMRLRLILRRVRPPAANRRSSPSSATTPWSRTARGRPWSWMRTTGISSKGHGPSAFGRFAADAAWLAFSTLAHDQALWVLRHRPPRATASSRHHRPAASPPVLRSRAERPLRPPRDRASAPAPAPAAAVPQRPPPDLRRQLTARPASPWRTSARRQRARNPPGEPGSGRFRATVPAAPQS